MAIRFIAPWFLLTHLTVLTAPALADSENTPADRLYEIVMTRTAKDGTTMGQDYPAPLLWFNSSYLIVDPTYQHFVAALDALNAQSEQQIDDYGSRKRALLQRQLWAVFDWALFRHNRASAEPESTELLHRRRQIQQKVVTAMRRLALSESEIIELPNPIHRATESNSYPTQADPQATFKPFLPANLFDPQGPWVCLCRPREGLSAPLHSSFESWRSTFLVFIRLPDGRRQTLEYLKTLNTMRQPIRIDEQGQILLHEETPEFPNGTQLALVEQPLLISNQGVPVATNLVYRIELRQQLSYEITDLDQLINRTQAVAEFVLQPQQWINNQPALRPLTKSEIHYDVFAANDPFEFPAKQERKPQLRRCTDCHMLPGVKSFASRHRQLQFRQIDRVLPAILKEGDRGHVARRTIDHKRRDYSWGVLKTMWREPAVGNQN